MKVKHSWHHAVMMCCDFVITIKWLGETFEHDDRLALSWLCVLVKIV